MDPIKLNIFSSQLASVCEQMGQMLRNAAYSPNIRDRLDFSCAVFDARGALCAQAAHIPVHLGSMAYAMADVVSAHSWAPDDQLILNDPYLGGTHLPDVTLIAPVHVAGELAAFVVNRAHHADIGAASPGSMPISRTLAEEGICIPPTHLVRGGELCRDVFEPILSTTRNRIDSEGDFSAQLSANRKGVSDLKALIEGMGVTAFEAGLRALNDYAQRLARESLKRLPDGVYRFEDVLDDDGQGQAGIPLQIELTVDDGGVLADFTGSARQVDGNINCPLSVVAAAVYYVFRCLMPEQTPACAGTFEPIRLHAPRGSLLNAEPPAAVAAGNVETSSRIVDLVCGALAQAAPELIPAASQGTMNNLAMGSTATAAAWDYYETMGGGMGAGAGGGGISAVQTHMTNTRNTPIEVMESRYPLRVSRYQIRQGSGGAGRYPGGEGLVREFEFLAPAHISLLTERRLHRPWGLQGGGAAAAGRNLFNGRALPPKCEQDVESGDRLCIETPGGGGWGVIREGD